MTNYKDVERTALVPVTEDALRCLIETLAEQIQLAVSLDAETRAVLSLGEELARYVKALHVHFPSDDEDPDFAEVMPVPADRPVSSFDPVDCGVEF